MKIRRYISSGRGQAIVESVGYYFIPAAIFATVGALLVGVWWHWTVIYFLVALFFVLRWADAFYRHYVCFDGAGATVFDGRVGITVERSRMVYAEPVEKIIIEGKINCNRIKQCEKLGVFDKDGNMLFFVSDSRAARDFLRDGLGLLLFEADK